MNTIKVYGIQRSGNNWLMHLLAANFKVNLLGNNKGGWTHGNMDVVKHWGSEPDVVCLLVRHPLMWLPSIWRWRGKKKGRAFAEYVQKAGELDLWNKKYHSWLFQMSSFKHARTAILRYEDLLANPQRQLRNLGLNCGLTFKREDQSICSPAKRMGTKMNVTEKRFNAEHYKSKGYLKYYTPQLLKWVKNRIDGDTLDRLGYRRDS